MAKKKFYTTKVESNEPDCEACGLSAVCKSPKLTFIGKGKKNVLIIGAQPSSREDLKGSLGYGSEVEFLADSLEEIGVDLWEDCFYTCAVSCRPPRDRAPSSAELKACRSRLDRVVDRLDPVAVVLLGEVPFNYMVAPRISGRLTGTPAKDFYGECIFDQELGRWVVPTWSPENMLECREYEDGAMSKPFYQRDEAVFRRWKKDLAQAFTLEPVAKIDYASMCKTTQDIDIALDWIDEAMGWESVAFDYETSGIKPFRKGHFIKCTSISNGKVSYSFPFFDDNTFRRSWKRLMTSPSKKIAHNIAFEGLWTREICGYWLNNWYWDTMLGQHCVYNQSPTGLKWCTYAAFGVIGYDSSADHYLKASKAEVEAYGDNAFNTINEAPIEDLLLYNAMDSLFTALLVPRQIKHLTAHQMDGMQFLMDSTITLTKMQYNGFYLNSGKYTEVVAEMEGKIKSAEEAVMNSPEVAVWDGEEAFNFNSGPQLGHLLYDILKLKPPFLTGGGKPSVEAEALEKLNCPLVDMILTHRKYKKLLGTYIHQYSVEVTDGKIHPFFYLNRVDTYRSSCGSVNVQNLPQRDKEASDMITSLVLPKKGHKLISYDYKSLEVLICACHSGDKNLIEFTSNPEKDMHRSSAADIFMLEEKEVTKRVRSGIKSAFVFSSWYGSYYKQTAPDCWELAQKEGLIQHLSDKGIKTYQQFEDRVKLAEDILWHKRFKAHQAWKDNEWKQYQQKGYLEAFTGFRFYAPMRRNNTFNSPVQCDAYHVMQWALNGCVKEMEERGMEAYAWAQVHDAADFSCPPEEEGILDALVGKWFIEKVTEHWPWIKVNLQIAKEAGEIDTDWSTIEEVGYLDKDGHIRA